MNLSPEISSSLRQAASVIQSAYAQAYWLPTNQRRDKNARNVRYASNSDRILRRSETTLCVESRSVAVALGRTYLLPPLSSGGALMVPPWLRFHIPLIGRVEDWRAGVGRSLYSLLPRPFVCECHTISTMPRFQPPPRRTQHADFLALRSPVCFASRLMGPILPGRLSTSVAEPGSR